MTTKKKCDWVDCPRKPNLATGRCDLHDVVTMMGKIVGLINKTMYALDRIARKDREDNHESDV